MILEKELWTDASITFLSSDIVEYDMKEAGFSIIRENRLLNSETIKELAELPNKDIRHRKIGLLERGNRSLRQGMSNGFKQYRLWFGEANGLKDEDILSIKKDAIFVKKFCDNTEYGDYVKFAQKHVYYAFMQFTSNAGKFEFYLGSDSFDVKGLHDNNVVLHENGMIPVIKRVMSLLSQYDELGAKRYVVRVMNDYKKYKVPVEYYREFNSVSGYRLLQNDEEHVVREVGESYKTNLIIDYNYVNVLVPLLNIVMG